MSAAPVLAASNPHPVQGSKWSDSRITQSITYNLNANWQKKPNENVTFDVKDGKVTLKGTVFTDAEKSKIEALVKNVHSVNGVDNQIQVVPAK
jgi:osmotically-inducible protein OsmY